MNMRFNEDLIVLPFHTYTVASSSYATVVALAACIYSFVGWCSFQYSNIGAVAVTAVFSSERVERHMGACAMQSTYTND